MAEITERHRVYLGDGLYAVFDGYELALFAEAPNTDVFYLDPSVWQALVHFMEKFSDNEEAKDGRE